MKLGGLDLKAMLKAVPRGRGWEEALEAAPRLRSWLEKNPLREKRLPRLAGIPRRARPDYRNLIAVSRAETPRRDPSEKVGRDNFFSGYAPRTLEEIGVEPFPVERIRESRPDLYDLARIKDRLSTARRAFLPPAITRMRSRFWTRLSGTILIISNRGCCGRIPIILPAATAGRPKNTPKF